MASKDQYEFFKMMYEEEERRYDQLVDRGKSYITILAAYAGFMIIKGESFTPLIGKWSGSWLIKFSLVFLFIGFVSTILALSILRHEGICDPSEVASTYRKISPKDEDFFNYRIADFVVACERNARSNDWRAIWLNVTVIAMMCSISCYVIALLYQL
jgi:hypothetical protein